MKYLPLLLIVAVLVGLLAFSARARRRQSAAEFDRAATITAGSQVMTTSGLYGTVVARHDDESVQLSIAPGVEVRWALAALRELADLPGRYRPGDVPDEITGGTTGAVADEVPDGRPGAA